MGKRFGMRYLPGILFALVLIGCTTPMDIIQSENLYFQKTALKDANAPYIGNWTAAVPLALLSIHIKPDGRVLMCSSNPYFGTSRGIVYKENNELFMIFEGGANYKIKSVTNDAITTEYLNQEYKFLVGRVPETCIQLITDFKNE